MASLIADVPEAEAFCRDVRSRINNYKLFPQEEFAHVMDAVLSTTGIDSQGHAFEVEQLEAFADSINSGRYWGGMHHDPRIHPISRGLAAKVFHHPASGVQFLVAVLGFFDASKFPKFSDVGIDLAALPSAEMSELTRSPAGPYAKLALNPHEVDIASFEHALADAPLDTVDRHIAGRFRKAAEPSTIVSISVSLWLLTNTPFGKKFLERYGDVAAEQSLKFFAWLKNKVVRAVSQLTGPTVMLELDSEHAKCRFQFIVASKDADVLTAAVSALPQAADNAMSLAMALASVEAMRLVYEYDKDKKAWLPLHATTAKRGIIADRPLLITAQEIARMGLSIGGSAPSVGHLRVE